MACTQPNTQAWNMKLVSPHYICHYWTEGVINEEIWRVLVMGSKLESSHIKQYNSTAVRYKCWRRGSHIVCVGYQNQPVSTAVGFRLPAVDK
jgi:hypothetical protein